jgi:hypothetical protein
MKLITRFCIVMAVCLLGLGIQGVLFGYLDQANLEPGKLTRKLEHFPPELGAWIGKEFPLEKPYDFADDSLRRLFVNRQNTQQQVLLWMVYSDCGEDREHNPVVCHGVAGAVEDLSARKSIEVPGHPSPIQQYRFRSDGKHTLVYYWYYTLPSPERKELSSVQKIYSEIRQPPASMTIEIFVPESGDNDAPSAIEFARLVDKHVQPFVGPSAVRGSARRPVKVVAPAGA